MNDTDSPDVEQRRLRALGLFLKQAHEGRVDASAFIPLSPDEIRSGWRQCVATLQAERATVDTITALQVLRLVDPSFEKAHFLLGLAYTQLGDDTSARRQLELQLERGVASLEASVREMLGALPAP
jgi:hypothetical protein